MFETQVYPWVLLGIWVWQTQVQKICYITKQVLSVLFSKSILLLLLYKSWV